MKTDAFRKSWIAGAGLAAVFLAAGLTTAEARMISDDPAKAHAEQSRDAGEVITDGWITTKVKSKLLADSDVAGLDITVETRNNVVVLSGEAETQAQVTRAAELARDTEGVQRVDASALRVATATGQVRGAVGAERDYQENQSARRYGDRDADERRSPGEAISDGWITTKVKSKLLANTDVSGLDITVETRDYVVHLSGEVESQAQFDIAVQLATETEGVVEVDASGLVIVPAD
jgi:osmotically-inducible protein OsmY